MLQLEQPQTREANPIEVIDHAVSTKQILDQSYYVSFVNYLDASEKTIQTYTRNLRQFAKYLEDTGEVQPTRETIIQFKKHLQDEGYKPTTIQSYITVVRLFFEWLDSEGLYPNIAEHIKGVKIDKAPKKDYLTSRQVKKVLEVAHTSSIEGLRDYAILCLMFTGALRTIEVCRANISDLKTRGDSTVLYIQGKGHTDKDTFIKIDENTETAIRAYLTTRGKETDDNEPLFISHSNNSKGNRLTTRSIRRIVKQSFLDAGLNSDRLTAHSTRHTAVTLALLNGEDIREVQQFARHENLNTTLIYAHDLDKEKNHCGQTVASAIFN